MSPVLYGAAAISALLLVGITVTVGLLLLQIGQPVVVTTPAKAASESTGRIGSATPLPVGAEATAPPTPTALPLPTASAAITPAEALNQALHATVQVVVPVTGAEPASTGSGSVLTEQGHILTNFHVLGDVATGRLFNERGLIYIAISPANLRQSPELKYQAQLVEADLGLDLALLKITALQEGGALPPDFALTPISIGNSDTVNIGDALTIIGFPGLGGETVTLTRGSVSGFLPEGDWIKTDAEINPGNSGGAAVDLTGRLVGIPTQITLEREDLPGKIGLIRPVTLARPLIDKALNDTP